MENDYKFELANASKSFANLLRTYNLGNKSVLDIGASHGEHLIHFGAGSVGLTLSKPGVEMAKERNLDLRLCNIEEDDSAIAGMTFDVIYCNNLLEHLYSPHAFLIKARKYLKTDGMMILGVPCIPKITPLIHIKKFRGAFAVAHINFYTYDTLKYVAGRGGWNIDMIRGFHVASPAVDHLLRWMYPHFYAIVRPDWTFEYHEKRMHELAGYKEIKTSV